MSASRNKPPSERETDFSDLNEVLSDAPPPARPSAPPSSAPRAAGAPVVRPPGPSMAPPRTDIRRSVTPFGAPPSRLPGAPGSASARPTSPPPLNTMAAPTRRPSRPPPPDRWVDDLGNPLDDLFAAGEGPPDPSRDDEEPPHTPTSPGLAVPPPPPRLPALGPEPEISFGLEPDVSTEVRRAPPANDARRPTTSRYRVEQDLSWGPRETDDLSQPVAPPPAARTTPVVPTALPRPSDEDTGDAYSLVHKASLTPPAVAPPPDPRREMNDRFALGDFSGALVIAEALVAENRADAVVEKVLGECRARLEQMYASRLGAMNGVPSVAVAPSELRWLSLDHRAGFVLSLVDGRSSIEEIIDISGMSALEVLRVLYELLSQRVIQFAGRGAIPRR